MARRRPALAPSLLLCYAAVAWPATLVRAGASAPLPPVDLLCELRASPVLGVDTPAPRFSWALISHLRNTSSVAFQIIVTRASLGPAAAPETVWDSGRVLSNLSTNIPYQGKALTSSTAYSWKARWWSSAAEVGPSEYSEEGLFVTGVFRDEDWHGAEWLTCRPNASGHGASIVQELGEGAWPVVGPPQCRHFRTEFSLEEAPTQAFLHVAAMGWVEVRINGAKAGGGAVLEPGWTQYDTRLLYSTYNVTELLQAQGPSALAVVLGNGWPGHLGHTTTFKLLLVAQFADGRQHFVGSTTSAGWQGTFGGPVLLDDIYGGETYDAREELDGFDSVTYDKASAQVEWVPAVGYQDNSTRLAVLSAQSMAPILAAELLEPRSISNPAPGVFVADFGQNIAGWARLTLTDCPRGTTIRLSFGEVVHRTDHPEPRCSCPGTPGCGPGSDCCKYLENGTSRVLDPQHNCTWWRGMVNQQYLLCGAGHSSITGDRCAVDLYTCKGGGAPEDYEPRFTYHGFRFAQVEGFPGPLRPGNLSARVIHSDVALQVPSGRTATGSLTFEGSAAKSLSQLQSNIRWTQLNNLQSLPTDCHQRTERQGWMADGSLSAEEAIYNFWMGPLHSNWLRSIADTQADYPPKDPRDTGVCKPLVGRNDCAGSMPDTAPHTAGTYGGRPGDPSWALGLPLVAWYHLRYTGDVAAARERYESIRAYADFILSCAAKDPAHLCQFYRYGDWLEPHCLEGWPVDRAGPMCRNALRDRMTAAFSSILAVRIAGDFAQVLGEAEDEARFREEERSLLKQWHATYFNAADETYGDSSQSVLSFTLLLGAAPTAELKDKVLQQLVAAIRARGNHVSTGIIGTKWMPEALSHAGRSDVALDLVLQPTAPSWLDQVAHDATTVWENWQYADGPAMNSHCHPALASIGAWLYRWLAGIRLAESPEEPGFAGGYSHVIFAPGVVDDPRITSAAAEVPTARGTVGILWSSRPPQAGIGGQLMLNVSLPPNTRGEVRLPAGVAALSEEGSLIWTAARGVLPHRLEGLVVDDSHHAGRGLKVHVGSGSYGFLAERPAPAIVA